MIELYYEFKDYIAYRNTVLWSENKIREWCNENCLEYFIIDLLGNEIKCSFTNETDAIGFKLRWL